MFEREILANPKATEHDASRFFDRFPKFLRLGEGEALRREVVFVDPSNRTMCRVDFFRKSYGRHSWDIIEVKRPQVPFVVNAAGAHPCLSSSVKKALDQAEDYRDLIIASADVRVQLLRKGIRVYRPRMIVVAGRLGDDLPNEVIEVLKDRIRRGPIEAWSFTDIFAFAKEHYVANAVIVWPGQPYLRVPI